MKVFIDQNGNRVSKIYFNLHGNKQQMVQDIIFTAVLKPCYKGIDHKDEDSIAVFIEDRNVVKPINEEYWLDVAGAYVNNTDNILYLKDSDTRYYVEDVKELDINPIKTVMVHLFGDEDFIWEKGKQIGLKGDVLQKFTDCLYEVELGLEVNSKTGEIIKILKVNNIPLDYFKKGE